MNPEPGQLRQWMALNAAPGIGPVRFHQILKGFRSLDQAFGADAGNWARIAPGLGLQGAEAVLRALSQFDADRELDLLARMKARVLSFCDEDYPRCLLPLHAAPPLLYLRGSLPQEGRRSIAVVGTRTPTEYGLAQCRALTRGLATAGLNIISGLAKGIDAAAHVEAMAAGGATFGVLGSGLGMFYPSENKALAERMIAGGGGLISQFPMQAGPEKYRFPMRNGTISGLSSGVLVVEGEEDSGSLITAEWALEQGRDIFAVPGPVDSRFSRGPNRLIQQGAKLVLGAEDLLAEFPEFEVLPRKAPREAPAKAPREALTTEEAKVCQAIAQSGRMALDELAGKTGMAVGPLSALLTMLEIKGAVRQLPGTLVETI